jgi:hypothetical protein
VLTAHGSRFKTCCEFSCFPEAGSKYFTFFHLSVLCGESRSKTALTLADLYNNDCRSSRLLCGFAGSNLCPSGFPQCWTSRAAESSGGVGDGVARMASSLLAVTATQ